MRVGLSTVSNYNQQKQSKQDVSFGDLYINTTKKALRAVGGLTSDDFVYFKKLPMLDNLWNGLQATKKLNKGSGIKAVIAPDEQGLLTATISLEDLQKAKQGIKGKTPFIHTIKQDFVSQYGVDIFLKRLNEVINQYSKTQLK